MVEISSDPATPAGISPVFPPSEMVLEATGGDVRGLQRKLWVAAKRSPGRRFHALYDRIYRSDVLLEAWRRVQKNRGAAGVDGQTLAAVEEYGVERLLASCNVTSARGRIVRGRSGGLRSRSPEGGVRPLGIPTVRDRVVQQAARIVLEPIFEADFLAASYGFRPQPVGHGRDGGASVMAFSRGRVRVRGRHP